MISRWHQRGVSFTLVCLLGSHRIWKLRNFLINYIILCRTGWDVKSVLNQESVVEDFEETTPKRFYLSQLLGGYIMCDTVTASFNILSGGGTRRSFGPVDS